MTDEKFTELVNLYFDKEISPSDLEWLKSEIASCPDRKRAFAERCRLHKAMHLALKPRRSSHSRPQLSSSNRSRPLTGRNRVSRFDEAFAGARSMPRWMLASGMAASLLVGLLLLPPVFRDTASPRALPGLVGVSKDALAPTDPLADLGKSELRRYAVVQEQREAKDHASLIAQMRLMGLRPELTPKDKQLREVVLADHYEPKHKVSQAELFQRLQVQKAMPEPKLLRLQEFESAPASFWLDAPESSAFHFEEL